MLKYWLVFTSALQDTLEYRFNLIVTAFKYVLVILAMALIWIAVDKEQSLALFDRSSLITYYVFAAIVYGLSNYHLGHLEGDIRLGYISKFLVKPVSPFLHYCSYQSGYIIMETLVKALTLIPLLLLFGFRFHLALPHVLLFLGYMPLVFLTTFCLYFLISTFSFWFQEVFSIRYTVLFTSRFLSGLIVPISLFPDWYQHVSRWLPFQYFAFIPIEMISGKLDYTAIFFAYLVLMGWGLVFYIVQRIVWHQATHAYESTGI